MKIGIIGSGNVAFHLLERLRLNNDFSIVIWSPSIASKADIIANTKEEVINADCIIIAVHDDKIGAVQNEIPIGKLVLHTSGATAMDKLSKHESRGVLYPLQTFSRKRAVIWEEIPILIENNRKEDLEKIQEIADTLSSKSVAVDSVTREKIHVAAVFVNNFTQYILSLADEWVDKEGLDKVFLSPLLDETIKKFKTLTASEAQTGPAKRNDKDTIAHHLSILSGEQKEVYQFLSDKIAEKYSKP